jgi:nitrilase
LICWENYMPLARYTLYAEGVQIYVASTWDSGEGWIASMRHIASEGRCWVISSGCALALSDIPEAFPSRESVFQGPDRWLNPGDSVIVAPNGDVVAGPLREEYGILYADIDATQASNEHRALDVAGHYGRPDIFTLTVDRSPRLPIHIQTTQ